MISRFLLHCIVTLVGGLAILLLALSHYPAEQALPAYGEDVVEPVRPDN